MKKIFLTGISGQDGSYLAEHHLELGNEVFGMVRRNSVSENQQSRIEHIKEKLNLFYGDLTDQTSLEKILTEVKPDEIYNLAAQSHVRISFDIPQYTIQSNSLGVINLLEAYKRICPKANFYQASSSEMFGLTVEEDGFQRETTIMNPVSPYGCSKVLSYNLVRHYRRAYGLKASNGILFNHESPRRSSNFVTSKVVKSACEIKLGLRDKLELGNMDSFRDWGHSKDYCIDLDTQILTTDGYKYRHEININDEIITYNINENKWELDYIEKIYDVEHIGKMYNFLGNGINFRCSPNHRIFYQQKSKNSKNWNVWKETTAKEMFEKLASLKLREKYNFRFPGFSGFDKEDFNITDDMLVLIGYLVTEGCLSKSKIIGGGTSLSVSQSSKKYLDDLLKCLKKLNLTYNRKIREDGVNEFIFSADSRDIILEYFENFDIHELPNYIYKLSNRQLNILYKTMMNCDGCWSSMSYTSSRKKLAEQFYDIVNLCGYRASIKKRKLLNIYNVTIFSKAKKSICNYITDVYEENVNENIWCIETKKNKTIITKGKEGRFISGNCKAMTMINNHTIPDDFVISTMETHSVRGMCDVVFKYLNLNYQDYVIQNPKYLRPEELPYLKGDSTKARNTFGWKPSYTFEELMHEMVDHWMDVLQGKKSLR